MPQTEKRQLLRRTFWGLLLWLSHTSCHSVTERVARQPAKPLSWQLAIASSTQINSETDTARIPCDGLGSRVNEQVQVAQ